VWSPQPPLSSCWTSTLFLQWKINLWARKTKSHNTLLGHVQSYFHHT
jgi:hypothetical protein